MSEFNPTPFKGEAGVPHVPEDWFTTLFISTQVSRKLSKKMLTAIEKEQAAAAAVVAVVVAVLLFFIHLTSSSSLSSPIAL